MGDVKELLRASLRCLRDECPDRNEFMLCQKNEDYCDGICEECWRQYLYAVANGETRSGAA